VKNAVIDRRTFFGEHFEETVFFTIRRCLVPQVTVIWINRGPMVDNFDVDAYIFTVKSFIEYIEQLEGESVGNAINVPAVSVGADCPFVGFLWISFRGYAEQVSCPVINLIPFLCLGVPASPVEQGGQADDGAESPSEFWFFFLFHGRFS